MKNKLDWFLEVFYLYNKIITWVITSIMVLALVSTVFVGYQFKKANLTIKGLEFQVKIDREQITLLRCNIDVLKGENKQLQDLLMQCVTDKNRVEAFIVSTKKVSLLTWEVRLTPIALELVKIGRVEVRLHTGYMWHRGFITNQTIVFATDWYPKEGKVVASVYDLEKEKYLAAVIVK